jgi:hypothetical protein
LSTADAAPVGRPTGLPTTALAHAILWFAVFLGGFVFFEPAPYELFLALILPIWLLSNPPLPRALAPLFGLMALFIAGGVVAMTQAEHISTQPIYYAVTSFLALSSCFYAAVLGAKPSLYRVVINAWIIGSLITVVLGLLGYFGLTGELFTKYDRAAGGFQDPNVFGPFLVFPFIVLVRRAITGSLLNGLLQGALALFLFAGIFLSFSRAAWGLAVVVALFIGAIVFVTERNAVRRARYIGVGMAGLMTATLLLAAALSVPAVKNLFDQRAQIVQDYDAGHLGRFERHAIGFNLMLDHPLGIGAIEFGRIYGEDEHDIWLKSLTTYGWLGFSAYLGLVVWTLVAAFPLMFRTGPLQPVVQAAYLVFAGHVLVGTVIDIDHWRHVYLLFGMLWGAIAADRYARQDGLAQARGAAARSGPPLATIA